MKKENILPIKINFSIPISPNENVKRFVFVYVIDGERLILIDTGVAGAEKDISIALQKLNKNLSDVDIIILTHSHPDHIGAASLIQNESKALVWAHPDERAWIEDVQRQQQERPVPGFTKLVAGSVLLDRLLADGDVLSFAGDLSFKVLHTPGHSAGSICLLSEEHGILFSGDLVPQPNSMPIYEDVVALANSLVRIAEVKKLTALYSSWCDPLYGQDAVDALHSGMRYLMTIHNAVSQVFSEPGNSDPMDLCRRCAGMLGLPPFSVNPLVLRSFIAHKEAEAKISLNSIFTPFLES